MRRVAVVMAALVAVGCGGKADEERRREDPKLLYDRVWIDRLPEKRTDYMHGMFVLGQRPFGGFHKASSYDFHFEVFFYGRQDKAGLKYRFPQTEKKGELRYQITACDDQPPFDLCLELSKNPWGGPRKFYGQREEKDAALLRLRAELVERIP